MSFFHRNSIRDDGCYIPYFSGLHPLLRPRVDFLPNLRSHPFQATKVLPRNGLWHLSAKRASQIDVRVMIGFETRYNKGYRLLKISGVHTCLKFGPDG